MEPSVNSARGQAENLIELHKSQLASDRTSCRSPLANQVRLVLHTGTFWLMLRLRDAIPKPQPLAQAGFTTLRMRLIKIGARIAETASRMQIAFAAAHPEAALFASLAHCLTPPDRDAGASAPNSPNPANLQRLSDTVKKTNQETASDAQDAATASPRWNKTG